jgi:hypothetical protein
MWRNTKLGPRPQRLNRLGLEGEAGGEGPICAHHAYGVQDARGVDALPDVLVDGRR